MTLTALSFFVLYFAATVGEGQQPTAEQLAGGSFRINQRIATNLKADGVPQDVLDKLMTAKDDEDKNVVNDVKFSAKEDEKTKVKTTGEQNFIDTINKVAPGAGTQHREAFLRRSYLFQVSPFWLLLAYAIISLGELMLCHGTFARFKSRTGSNARAVDGRLVCGDGNRQQADDDRNLLEHLVSVEFLSYFGINGSGDGICIICLAQASEKSYAGCLI